MTRAFVFVAVAAFMVWALGRAVDYELDTAGAAPPTVHVGDGTLIKAINTQRARTWRCQTQLGRTRSSVSYAAERSPSVAFRKWTHRLWRTRAAFHCNAARQVGDLRAWMCIHRYEGAWNDPNPPYYGGLQMDLQFQRDYGAALLRAKGTADNWTPLEQIIVAERARRSGRGYHPWPNAARLCGLI